MYELGKIVVISKLDKDAINFTKTLAENGQKLKIILLSDALFLLEGDQLLGESKSEISENMRFYALDEDMETRNVTHDLIQVIDYSKLVDILMEPDNSIINL